MVVLGLWVKDFELFRLLVVVLLFSLYECRQHAHELGARVGEPSPPKKLSHTGPFHVFGCARMTTYFDGRPALAPGRVGMGNP